MLNKRSFLIASIAVASSLIVSVKLKPVSAFNYKQSSAGFKNKIAITINQTSYELQKIFDLTEEERQDESKAKINNRIKQSY